MKVLALLVESGTIYCVLLVSDRSLGRSMSTLIIPLALTWTLAVHRICLRSHPGALRDA